MAEITANATAVSRRALPMRRRNKFLPLFFLMPAMIILLLLQVWPTIYSVYLSTTELRRGVRLDVGLGNFEKLFRLPSFVESLRITFLYAGSYVGFTLVLGMLIALLLNRRIRYTGGYLILLFIPWVLSDVVAGTMWRWLFQPTYGLVQSWVDAFQLFGDNSLYNTAVGSRFIILGAAVWRGLAFSTILSLGALQTVPQEIIESASLDGANRFARFWRIILPNILSVILVMVLLSSIQAINSLGLVYSITRGGPGGATTTTAYYLYRTAWEEGKFDLGAAISVVLFLINVVLTILYLIIIGGSIRKTK
jgi:multiple sugar transport system permease protein